MEILIVFAIVGAALAYLAIRLYRWLKKPCSSCMCDGCQMKNGCSFEDKERDDCQVKRAG